MIARILEWRSRRRLLRLLPALTSQNVDLRHAIATQLQAGEMVFNHAQWDIYCELRAAGWENPEEIVTEIERRLGGPGEN